MKSNSIINEEMSPAKLAATLGISLIAARQLWKKYKKDKSLQKYGKKSKTDWSSLATDVAEGPWQLRGGS